MEYGDRDLLRFQACEMVSLKFGLAIDDDRRDAKPDLKNRSPLSGCLANNGPDHNGSCRYGPHRMCTN